MIGRSSELGLRLRGSRYRRYRRFNYLETSVSPASFGVVTGFFFFFTEFSLIVRPSRYGGRRRGPSRRRGRCQIKKKTKKGIENEKLKNKNKKKPERAERENDEPSATTKVNAFLFSDLSKRKIEKKTKIK